MESPYTIRLARPDDLPGFLALSELAGPGFTSLALDRDGMRQMLEKSVDAARGASGSVILALEEAETGRIAGCAAIKRCARLRPGFGNFKVAYAPDGTPSSIQVCTDYGDLTEIGGLFVCPQDRARGVGKSLAQSRYLYLATAPEAFGERVFAELRGVINTDGATPFFNAVGARYLDMSFVEADRVCARGDNDQLIARLPREPISTASLPPDAIAVIGGCHETGQAARAMLLAEGFKFEGVVDLLDGGALLAAKINDLTTLTSAQTLRACRSTSTGSPQSLLFSTLDPEHFRCVYGDGVISDSQVFCGEGVFDALRLQDNDIVRVSPLKVR